jgi:hypothetical protein
MPSSKVHADVDIEIQSYLLSIPSATQSKEIENKAFMVAASHWLDDLLDGGGGGKYS